MCFLFTLSLFSTGNITSMCQSGSCGSNIAVVMCNRAITVPISVELDRNRFVCSV